MSKSLGECFFHFLPNELIQTVLEFAGKKDQYILFGQKKQRLLDVSYLLNIPKIEVFPTFGFVCIKHDLPNASFFFRFLKKDKNNEFSIKKYFVDVVFSF